MTSTKHKAAVTRLSKETLLRIETSDHIKKITHPLVPEKRRSKPLKHKKNRITPKSNQETTSQQINHQNRTSYPLLHAPETITSSTNLHSTNRISSYREPSITSFKSKDMDISFPYDHSKSISNKSLFTLGQHATLKDNDEEEKNTKILRRDDMFKITQCCCCTLLVAALGLIVLGAIIAAIIIIALQPKTTTTKTTTTTSTTSTSTSTTATTSTTSTSTSSTSTTSETTTSTETTTTVTYSSCNSYFWNQTSAVVADTATNTIADPCGIYIDVNDTLYLSGHTIGYVQTWIIGAVSRTQLTTNYGDHIDYIIFDNDGYMYTNAHDKNIVRRFPPGSPNGIIYAGVGSNVSGTLNYPVGIAVDDNFTLYIADRNNDRIVKREQDGTSLVTVINTANVINQLGSLALSKDLSDEIYISDQGKSTVYLWKFNATGPTINYTNVNDGTTLKNPRGIKLDDDGNLYVADETSARVVMFCANSTVGNVIANIPGGPRDIAFDSNMNLYVVVSTNKVLRYSLM